MKTFIQDILTQLNTVTGVQFTRVWNDQLTLDEQQEGYSFPMPALFPEILNQQEAKQLGDGIQLFENLIVRIHTIHWQLDAGDGTMEQNLDVFDFQNEVYKKMDGFTPAGAGTFVRGAEERDYQHKGVYHSIQDYKTNYLDTSRQRSTDGVTINSGTISSVINAEYDPIKPYLKGK
jgi:hypothetical protein